MTPFLALVYSLLFGLLHGILPDEHTWPITFSYAIGGGSGKAGMKAGLYFSAAFTFQRMLIAELSNLALVPFLTEPTFSRFVYVAVGVTMSAAGAVVLRRNRYPHLHLLGHHHEAAGEIETTGQVLSGQHLTPCQPAAAPPVHWTLVHGFVAGFGFGAFSVFVNAVAAPAMPSPWLGFLPGLLFGLGTMVMLIVIGALFGTSLKWARSLTEQEMRAIGSQTGGRSLLFGGMLFILFGTASPLGSKSHLPIDPTQALMGLFMLAVVIPALLVSWREVVAARQRSA